MTATIGCLRSAAGSVREPAARYLGSVGTADEAVLTRAIPPVLDIGFGPGRHVVALAERRKVALGIDITPSALSLARHRGAPVLERSVFGRVPATGRWATALLLDGNLGIGADPAALLGRVFELLRPGGEVLVETRPPGDHDPTDTLQLEIDGVAGPLFAWSVVGADQLAAIALSAGCDVAELWSHGPRWFGVLRRD